MTLLRQIVFGSTVLVAFVLPPVAHAQCTNCSIATVGANTVLTFTANGTFTPPAGVTAVRYLVVGGGGGGGGVTNTNSGGAGGGGAGGFRAGTGFAVTPGNVYNITVGAGGTGATCGTTCNAGTNGGNSIFSTITATGGGRGAYVGNNNGADGGSGGGGRLNTGNGGNGAGGEGNDGGDANAGNAAAGGGGASADGSDSNNNGTGGAGGDGTASDITGVSVTYAGGGGGGGYGNNGGAGGAGGGGSAPNGRGAGGDATPNTGGGGGGAGGSNAGAAFNGGNGGSGIVVILYGPGAATTYYSRNNGTWTGNNRWSLVGCGGASAGNAEPGQGDQVVICNGDNITLDTSNFGTGLTSVTIQAGGILDIGNSNTARTLTVAGDVTNAGTLQYNDNDGDHTIAIGGQFVNSGTFTSINNTDGGARTLTVAGLITNSGTIRFAGRNTAGDVMTVNANGGIVNGGTLDVSTGSNNTHALNVAGDFTNNGTVNLATDANSLANTTFNGAAAQAITGSSAASTFYNVTLNNANGLQLTGTHDITVVNTLTLTSGRIATNGNIVYVQSGNAVAGASASNFVVGNLRKRFATGNQQRVFEVGTVVSGTPQYAPVSIRFGNVGTAGDYTVTTVTGDHGSIASAGLNAALSVNRYWTFSNGGVGFTANANDQLVFTFTTADMDGAATLNSLDVGRFSGGAWSVTPPPTPAYASPSGTTRTVTLAGIDTLHTATNADYQIAERGVPLTLVSATAVCGVDNTVEVLFSTTVTPASAQNTANYALTGGATVSAAVLDAGGQVVTLTTSALAPGEGYTLTVNNVVGTAGGTLPVNSQATFFTEGGQPSGLVGTYFPQMNFAGTPVQRIDGSIDFDWVNAAPGVAGIGADNFSVRWDGYVTPPATGNYTFRTRSDDGVRLYVDTDGNGQFEAGNLVINNWTDHAATNNDSAVYALTSGQRYLVRMEYYENGGQAVAQLLWSGPGTGGFQFIPRAALSYSCGLPRPVAFYKLDELTWSGSAGEAADSSGNNLHGAAAGGAVPFPAQVCNGAQLDGTSRYVQVPHDNRLNATSELTVAAWINANALGAALKTIVSKDENFEFHLTNTGQINWWWQDSAANARQITTTGTAIAAGAWYHVAIVYASGSQVIYINGVSRGTDTFTGTLANNTDPLQIGADQYPAQPTRVFDGRIDEVRVYNRALSQADISQVIAETRPCVNLVTHYEIAFPNGATGVTCDPSDVLITAHDASHSAVAPAAGTLLTFSTASGTGVWQGPGTVSGSGVWTPSGLNNGAATYQWPGAETTVRVRLRHNTPATININVLDSNGRPESEETNLVFADTAFRVTADGVSDATLGTQIAGKPSDVAPGAQTLFLQAVKTDTKTGTCVGLIQNQTVTVQLAGARITPTGGASQVSVRNSGGAMTAIATNAGAPPGAYSDVSLAFDAQSKAPLVINYPDAGRLSVHARYELPSPPAGVFASGDTGQFVVRPFGFAFRGATAATPVQHGTDHGSAVLAAAGDDFTMSLAAYAWSAADDADSDGVPDSGANVADNSLTPNFSATTSISVHPVLGNTAGVAGAITRGGAAATIAAGEWSGGIATPNNWQYSEVGNVALTALSSDYLGSGTDVTGNSGHDAAGNYVGRFRAHHLFVSGAGVLTNRVDSACASIFTYMGEPIGLTFTLQARNASGTVTQNYAADYAKFDPSSIAQLGLGARNAAGAGLDLSGRVLGLTSSGGFASGAAMVTARLALGRGNPPPNAEAGPYGDVRIGVAPQEPVGADGVGMRAADFNLNIDGAGGNDHFQVGASTVVRFGRLRLENAVGSQSLDLPIAMRAEYWAGTAFVTNGEDNCTQVAPGNIAFGNYQGGISAVNVNAANLSGLGGVFAAGVGNFTLLKPSGAPPAAGSVDICVDLGPDTTPPPACAAGTPAGRSYLQGRNAGANYDDDPVARAAFGLFGAQPNNFIYFRENF
jgi:hypothetical protein